MSEAADSEGCLTSTRAYRELPLLADRVPTGKWPVSSLVSLQKSAILYFAPIRACHLSKAVMGGSALHGIGADSFYSLISGVNLDYSDVDLNCKTTRCFFPTQDGSVQ